MERDSPAEKVLRPIRYEMCDIRSPALVSMRCEAKSRWTDSERPRRPMASKTLMKSAWATSSSENSSMMTKSAGSGGPSCLPARRAFS